MPEKAIEALRNEAHRHGEEALRLFGEAKELQRKADLIKDIHLHREAMKVVHSKDGEAIEHIRKSIELGSELSKRHEAEAIEKLREIRNK